MSKSKKASRKNIPSADTEDLRRKRKWICLISALILLPFINKPFHLDDTLFIRLTENILEEPLAPYQFEYNWFLTPMPFWKVTQNPPLNSYILAIPALVFGISEIVFHLVGIGFAVGCAYLMFRISARYTTHPEVPALLTIVSPGFLVSATNVMADVPLLFFWLLSVDMTMSAVEEKREKRLWYAGLAIAAACMTKYFGMALLPLLFVYWFFKTKKFSIHLLAFLIPVLVICSWGLYAEAYGNVFHPIGAAEYSVRSKSFTDLLRYTTETVSFLGGSLFWPLLFIPFLFRNSTLVISASLLTSVMTAVLGSVYWNFDLNTGIHLGLMLFAGLTVILSSFHTFYLKRNADNLLLSLWFLGTIIFSILLNWTVNARILLIALFPLSVLFIQWIESKIEIEKKSRLYFVSIVTCVLSLSVAWGDYQLASASREFAQNYIREEIKEGRKVHFSGHWGFQYYMEEEGANVIDYLKIGIQNKDLVIYPTQNTNVKLIQFPGTRKEIKSYESGGVGPYTLNSGARAGFYSTIWGPIPYAFKTGQNYDQFVVDEYDKDSETILNKPGFP